MANSSVSKRRLIVGGLAAAAVVAAVGVAASQPWGGHGFGRDMRVGWGVNRMLDRIDATAEQKEKVTAIVKSALGDLEPLRASRVTFRQDAARLMKADKVDRAEIEKLRARGVAQADEASKRITQALADAADVLTAKQRAELVGRMEGFAFGRGMGRGDMARGEMGRGGHGYGPGRGGERQ